MVFVNTVVIVQASLGLTQGAVAVALASFGAGSIGRTGTAPPVGEAADRSAMLGGIGLMVAGLFVGTWVEGHASLMALWFALGLGYSTAQTPSGRLLRRSAHPEDRPALSPRSSPSCLMPAGCCSIHWPAGWVLIWDGSDLCCPGWRGRIELLDLRLFASEDPEVIEHEHPDLPSGHAHSG